MLKFNASTLCLTSRHNFDCKNYYFTVSSLVRLLRIMVNHQQNHLTGYISLGALGAYSLIKSYKYVPPQRVRFLHLSSLKMRIHFAYFGLDSGMVFEGTTSVYEHICCLMSK